MKSSRLVLNIISIIANILASLVFLAPVWYFANTTTINDSSSTLTTYTVNVFDYNKLNEINKIYEIYGGKLDTTFSKLFLIFAIITMLIGLVFIILTILTTCKKLPTYNKLPKTCKGLSIVTCLSSIISLLLAIIFVYKSKYKIIETNEMTYSLSVYISTGIYIFIIFELAGGICGYIANNIKDE